MKIVRTFHPVGQGAFYSERFQIWKPKIETHNIVYDCGVCYKKEKQVVHVVNQAFAGKDYQTTILHTSPRDVPSMTLFTCEKIIPLTVITLELMIFGLAARAAENDSKAP